MNLRIITLMLTLAFSSGCSQKFLELKNPVSVPLYETINDLASLTAAASGAYVPFKNANYYNCTFMLLPDLLGDNVFVSRYNGGRYLPQDNFAIGTTDGYINGAWASMYQVVVNSTLAMQGGSKLPLNAPVYQLLGEMYAVRALAYFDLVRTFAQPYNFTADASHPGVPVITEVVPQIISPARVSVREVYQQIVADLEMSLKLMNVSSKQGRFTPTAANALLAKVYLYMGNWAQAEKYATDAIAGPYTLLPRASYLGSWNSKFSQESLFEVANLATDNVGTAALGYFYMQSRYGEGLATEDLYNQYSSNDIRRSLIQVGVRFKDNVTYENPAYFIVKYPEGTSDNIKVLRLSEAYLIRAEARAELGMSDPAKTVLAQADLNTIAQRADPSAPNVTLTGTSLVERILLERRKELAFEGNRFFDLTRRKKDVKHIRSTEVKMITYPNDKLIMPIPLREMNYNSNMTQNPGWVQ